MNLSVRAKQIPIMLSAMMLLVLLAACANPVPE